MLIHSLKVCLVMCYTVNVRRPWIGCPDKGTFKFRELDGKRKPAEMGQDNYRGRKELVDRDQTKALSLCLKKIGTKATQTKTKNNPAHWP